MRIAILLSATMMLVLFSSVLDSQATPKKRLDEATQVCRILTFHNSGWVSEGQVVDMNVAAYPEKSWQGTVDYIYPILDAKTRTLRVRIRFDNKDGLLKPNMFSRLTIRSNFKTETLFVKREAVIRSGKMERIVKSLGDGKFLSVAIN